MPDAENAEKRNVRRELPNPLLTVDEFTVVQECPSLNSG
jgi:hypothetical protein